MPHAIEVEGQIIRVFDPVVHEPIATPESESLIEAGPAEDRRWVRCRRPLVTVGGELTLDALELTYLPVSGFYRAPLQALANGGVLVIDDFGRQRVAPRDLLNRWIVPLESRVDYLTLQTGQKFELPFVTLVVFATNIRPRDLVDEAFLRRIRYKVFAESPSADDFAKISGGRLRRARRRLRPGAGRARSSPSATGRAGSRCAAVIRATSSTRRCRSPSTAARPPASPSPCLPRRATATSSMTRRADAGGSSSAILAAAG